MKKYKKKNKLNIVQSCIILMGALSISNAAQADHIDGTDIIKMNIAIQKEINQRVEEFGLPGVSISYVLPNGYSAGFASGFADVEKQELMTPLSIFLSASNGKTYVGALVTKLAQNGVLDLDEKISKWLGDESWFNDLPNSNEITVRQLLNHTSGLKDHVHTPEFADKISNADNPDYVIPYEDIIKLVSGDGPLFVAGEDFSYTDTGFILIGLIIEKATEKSYYENLENHILNPLGLYNTIPNNHRAIPGLVQGYSAEVNPLGLSAKSLSDGLMTWNPANEFTGGGLASTPSDLALWAQYLFHNNAVSPNYMSDVLANAWPLEDGYYGLGVRVTETSNGCSFGHSGWIPGYISNFGYYPALKASVSIMVNSDKDENIGQNVFMLRDEVISIISNTLYQSNKGNTTPAIEYRKCAAYK